MRDPGLELCLSDENIVLFCSSTGHLGRHGYSSFWKWPDCAARRSTTRSPRTATRGKIKCCDYFLPFAKARAFAFVWRMSSAS